MDKRLREILHFFVALPRVFPLSVRARSRASTDLFIHKFLHLSISKTSLKQPMECTLISGVKSCWTTLYKNEDCTK